jgi:hypothetical protein
MSKADVAVRFALAQEGWFEERFLSKTRRDEESGCLLWTGAAGPNGYGSVSVKLPSVTYQVGVLAHRVAFAQAFGADELPKASRTGYAKFVIEHSCGNRLCVEPSHLRRSSAWAIQRRRFDG